MRRAGHSVTVVVGAAGGESSSPDSSVHVVREIAGPLQFLGRVSRVLKKFTSLFRASASESNHRQEESERAPNEPRSLIRSLASLPDERQGLALALFLRAFRLARQETFDLVYTSAPPFSVCVAGLLVAKLCRLPWTMELRDPWRSNGAERLAMSHPFTNFLDRWISSACFNRADVLVAVTERSARRMSIDFPSKSVLWGLNGIERLASSRAPSTDGRLRIVYSGSLYPPRDYRPIVRALNRVLVGSSIDFEYLFVGDCSEYDGEPVSEFMRTQLVADRFRYIPWVSQDTALSIIEGADLLILPAQQWVEQIPNKLYDYLGSRVPIMAQCSEDSETSRLLTAAGGHFVSHSELTSSLDSAALSAIQHATTRVASGDSRMLEPLTVERQFDSLVLSLQSALASRSKTFR